MNLAATIRAVQSKLNVEADGIAGPQTWDAIHQSIVGADVPAPLTDGRTDDRSEGNIATLLADVQPYARALIHAAAAQDIAIKVISGTRTYEQQDALFEQGRSKPGPRVTNARGGYSNHNFGIAFDIGIFDSGRYLEESPLYKVVGSIGKSLGLAWGGDWKALLDEPHYELRPPWARDLSERDLLTGLRDRHARGAEVFA